MTNTLSSEEVFHDTLTLWGEGSPDDDDTASFQYADLVLSLPPKEGKANSLLADQLFSPSLLLAEKIERNLIPVEGRTILELGAGCALPSLLAATSERPPSLVVATDFPDRIIMQNLENNVHRNVPHSSLIKTFGYSWGTDPLPLNTLRSEFPDAAAAGFDCMILSDLLYFDKSHEDLVRSITLFLRPSSLSRVYVAAGNYTPSVVCDNFFKIAEQSGLEWKEGEDDQDWRGTLPVKSLDREALIARKCMCRWWVGRWRAYRDQGF
ncbi:hypothetical protein SISNIDRAFT_446945 [Sistotremastrum niveocremeum HHB9708]|uniref:Nicotinamide N-methyltransferase n=1 Tax=Sistotremastrum niveocremeum HHB9708 TaxID=1314777 RepID=A0A164N0A9_9AGAM|nr:hypothetical protein SISNIDRAFT_446945 [Sistotremastrum niveocremeum HHB9708]